MRDTAHRLLTLLSLLQVRAGWTGEQLARRLAVTERTVRRDVDRLRELGYPVHASPGVGGGYRLGRGTSLPPLLLDDEAAVAVAVSLRTAAGGTVTGIAEAAMRALVAVEQVLPSRLRLQVSALQASTDSVSSGTTPVDGSMLLALAQACREQVWIEFGYQRHDETRGDRRVEPYRLVCTGRRWYLVARDRDRDDWRSFRVDRISDVRVSGQGFVPVDPPDAVAFVTRGVSSAAYRHQARVRLHVSAAEAAERISPTVGVLMPLGEACCELTTGADSLEAVALHLGMLGCEFDVLEPPGLAAALRELASRLARAASGPLPIEVRQA